MPKIVDHEEQRLQLSATVAAVIAEEGLEHTTLRTVAAHHGCTKGMVQHYFADKDELLLAALHYIEAQQDARLPEPGPKLDGLELLQARCLSRLPLSPQLHLEWRARLAFMGLAGLSPDIHALLSDGHAREQAVLAGILRRAQRGRVLRQGLSPAATSRSLSALVTGLAASAVADPPRWSAASQRQVLKSAVADLRR